MSEAQQEPQAAERHAELLDRLAHERRHYEVLGVGMKHHLAVVDGRRRILERHAPPDFVGSLGVRCPHCTGYGDTPTEWPCPDYRDAAADLFPEGNR